MSRLHILAILLFSLTFLSCAANKRKEEERLRRILEASASFHMEKAYAASDSGNHKTALNHLYKALDLAPWEPVIHNNIGVMHYRSGQLDSAIYYYQSALRVQPTYVHAYVNMAQAYLERGDYKLAHLVVNNGIEYNPKDEKLYLVRAAIYEKQELTDEAILNYKRALLLNPNNDAVYNNLGALYQAKGMLRESIKNYQKAIELNPDNAESYFNLGNAFARKCQLQEAVEYFSKALELRPTLFSGYNNRGLVYVSMGRPELALSDFNKALEISPESPIILFNLAIAFQRLDSLQKALDFIDRAITSDTTNAMFFVQKGNILAQQGKVETALANYKKASKLDEPIPIVYNNMGNTYIQIGQTERAQEAFKKAAELFPDFLESRYFTLTKSRQAGQVDLVAGCDGYSSLATEYAQIYNNLGKTYLQQNLLQQALIAFKQAIEIQPDLPESYENLAATYQLAGNSAAAREMLAQSRLVMGNNYFQIDSLNLALERTAEAVRYNPNLTNAFALLGLIYEKMGDLKSARQSFAGAMKIGNPDSEFYFAYGEFLSRQGRWQEAIDNLAKGISQNRQSIRGNQSLAKALKQTGQTTLAQIHQARVHFLMGKRREYAGQWDAALDEYITASQIDSNAADYFASQGLIYAKKHKHKTAETAFLQALNLDSQNSLALYGMGLVLGDQQKNNQAIDYLTRSIAVDPSVAQVHYVLAVNFYFAGKVDKAWQHALQAQKLGKRIKQEFLEELQKASKAKNE